MTKRRKTQDEQQPRLMSQQDDDYIPLPIQTFLWRQTSPFVRPFMGKARDLAQIEQRDACKLFERIIITNNIWGQSPSLTDAIASIDRWRLIKVSFPFVLQCTASLLNNKFIKDHTFNRLGGNEAKMMYTLQWILMNASEECADSELEAKATATGAAMAAATAAASLLKPSDARINQLIPSQGSTSSVSGAMATVGNEQVTPTSGELGGVGQLISGAAAAPQTVCAATSAAVGTVVAVGAPSGISSLQMQPTLPSSSSVSPIGSSTPTKLATPTSPTNNSQQNYLLPISSIQMFAYYFAPMMDGLRHSDFLTSNQRLEIGAALWEPLFNHQLPDIQCLIAQVRPRRGNGIYNRRDYLFESSAFFAPQSSSSANAATTAAANLAAAANISAAVASVASAGDHATFSTTTTPAAAAASTSRQPVSSMPSSSLGVCENRRRSSALMQEQAQFGDVFLGGSQPIDDLTAGGGSSLGGQQTPFPAARVNYATYLDVAVLRCLFISDWQESGVHWALSYLGNRLADFQYADELDLSLSLRPRSRSLDALDQAPTQKLADKTTMRKGPSGSKRARGDKQSNASHADNQSSSRFLRVEDAENSDSGEGGKQNPVRRLSFSSGVQTLANQIRKTSKRVKKSSESHESGSQMSIHNLGGDGRQSATGGYPSCSSSSAVKSMRRSSSADDLTGSQMSALSLLHKDSFQGHQVSADRGLLTDSNPVITVTPNLLAKSGLISRRETSAKEQQSGGKKKATDGQSQQQHQKRAYKREQTQDSLDVDQQFLINRLYSKSLKNLDRLTRSQTIPKDMHFLPFETRKDITESPDQQGATLYVDDLGRIDPIVVLKVIHSISQRECACSLRVCDRILSLISRLVSIGILKQNFNFARDSSTNHQGAQRAKELTNLLSTQQTSHAFQLIQGVTQILKLDSDDQNLTMQQRIEEALARSTLIHKILVDILFRLYNHLGCPNHCGMESIVDQFSSGGHSAKLPSFSGKSNLHASEQQNSVKAFRLKLRDMLDHLCCYNRENFITYVQDVFNDRPLQQVVDILHSLLGFCRLDGGHSGKSTSGARASGSQSSSQQQQQPPQATVQFLPTPSTAGNNYVAETGQLPSGKAGGSISSMHSETSLGESSVKVASNAPRSPQSQAVDAACSKSRGLPDSVENVIVSNSFKHLITRMAKLNKELKFQENAYLYCDIRRLIGFTRENYNSVFRSIVLSALIDSTKLLNQQQKQLEAEQRVQSSRCAPGGRGGATGEFVRIPSDDESTCFNSNGPHKASSRFVVGDPENASDPMNMDGGIGVGGNGDQMDTMQSGGGGGYNYSSAHQSPLAHLDQNSPRGIHSQQQQQQHRTPLNSHKFRGGKDSTTSPVFRGSGITGGHGPGMTPMDQQQGGILSLSKAKKKLEQVFGGKGKSLTGSTQAAHHQHSGDDLATTGGGGGGSLGQGESWPPAGSSDQSMGGAEEVSRKASLIGHQSMGSFHEQHGSSSRAGVSSSGQYAPTAAGNTAHLSNQTNQQPWQVNTTLQLLKQNAQLYEAIQTGMANFSFLMESCSPGDFLDPAMLAALLDLKSPVVIRAAIFLECANFVHKCNRGQWPPWMRMNMSARRTSIAPGVSASSGSGGASARLRKSSSIQRTTRNNTLMYRAAGRAFYSWAEAIGTRLEELLVNEHNQQQYQPQTSDGDSNKMDMEQDYSSSQLVSEHVNMSDHINALNGTNGNSNNLLSSMEIDFLQPTIRGDASPFALKMAACHLLFEVTTFLRETYRYLPPTIVQHQIAGTKLGEKLSIYDVSRAVTANRRWSMALSSLGFGQLPATLGSVVQAASQQAQQQQQQQQQQQMQSSGNHLRNPATAAIAEHPERRISFILHETNDEDENPSHGQSDKQLESGSQSALAATSPLAPSVNTTEQQQDAMRKMTAGRHLSQGGASSAVVVAAATCLLRSSGVIDSQSHRRKSIKLRKPSQDKEQREQQKKTAKFAQELDEDLENSSVSDAGVRRTDSIRSRRRVSGISEKSDTSDRTTNGQQQQHSGVTTGGQDTATSGCGGGGNAQELSGDESAGNGSCEENYGASGATGGEAADKYEDESRIMSNMPWFRSIAMINSTIDCNCAHFPSCKSYCYKLHQDTCRRLVMCVQNIYEDPYSQNSLGARMFETRLEKLMSLQSRRNYHPHHQRVPSQDSKSGHPIDGMGGTRAGSDCSASILDQSTSESTSRDKRGRDKKSKKQQQQTDSPRDEAHHHQHSGSGKAKGVVGKFGSSSSKQQSTMDSPAGLAAMMSDTMRALTLARAKERSARKQQDEPQIIKYIRSSVKSLLHCPMSSFLKGAVILPRENFTEMIYFSWQLLLEDDQQISRTAAVSFIIASIKCPSDASKLLMDELASEDASRKCAAINKFYVIWDARYQCWPRLEDGAFVHFKMAPPSIEFTLPSPKIAQESRPVVDPPWMPRKTSNVEEVTIGQDQSVQKSFVTATKTRRKQQIEIVTKALREKHDKLREDRENYLITSVPITLYAAYEPTLSTQASGGGGGGGDELDGMGGSGAGGGAGTGGQDEDAQENRALLQMKSAQALFPTCLCQAAIVMINLLDDSRVTYEGSAVYEVANKAIWSCLVDDPALFLRYFFERLTRQNQSTTFQVLRRLIRFMPRLPSQAAYTLYNYLIGFIIYCIRSSAESNQKLIAETLSVLCLVVPSVYGLFLKDLKQILRKEQCDHNLLITANIPGTKKIVVECESDSSGIPNQFDVGETTQFYHILVESLGFWKIERPRWNEHFLVDIRTNYLYNLHSYVRDFYSYKTPYNQTQLQVIKLDPNKAFDILQNQELINQFMEFGKVSMALAIVKSTHMAVQRVLFLHEELMKLPTFPRKALETNFGLFRGPLGHQVFSLDRIHKICWVRTIGRMFELTSGFFLQLGDIQLFLNAICGIFVLHCEEAAVLRLCLATFINATHQFKNIFATEGFMSIMGTIVQVYSNHQNNQLLCQSIEFVCKQFYIVHRKPFLLQLFGSVASRLNTAEILQQAQSNSPLAMNQSGAFYSASTSGASGSGGSGITDPSRISPAAFFRLLQSLEKAFKDPIDILELVDAEKPLRAIDFCYQQDKESIEMLDIISLCVTVTAYASDSPRSTQMLIILETVVPLYMKHLQASTSKKAGQSMGKQAHKDELQKIQSISICIRTLIVNCESLTRNFNGPLPSFDFRSSSIRRTESRDTRRGGRNPNNSAGSPMDFYADEPSISGPEKSKKEQSQADKRQANLSSGLHRGGQGQKGLTSEENEITRGEFLVPRDTLLNLVAEFLALSTGRLVESAKKYVDLHQKHSSYELLDTKSHLKLAEVANSLLKFASTDPSVMASRGLVRYMNEILPNTEWRQEAIRPALILILKRLDKTFNRIAKKTWIKRSTDWEGAKQLLKGAYLTFIKHPYIVHLPHLKSLISCCQNIILSDGLQGAQPSSNIFHSLTSTQQTATSASGISNTNPQVAVTSGGGGGQSGSDYATTGGQVGERSAESNLLSVSGGPAAATSTLAGTGGPSSLSPIAAGGVLSTTLSSSAGSQGASTSAPSFAALTAAALTAERLANAASSGGSSLTTQGFNSVTIRLIAMQLLQTGENQTLESLVGHAMNTPEKLESLMLNLIYPMCIRVCSGAREAPKLRVCDIMFILNIVLNMLAPNSASSKGYASASTSPKATTDTSQFILSKITTTIGSTQTGASALGIVGSSAHSAAQAHQVAQHQEALKIGFLGLKILCVCFEFQLAGEWIRVARVIRDLALQSGQPCGPLWDFLDFVATYRFPVFVLLLPMIKCQLASKVKQQQLQQQSSGEIAHYMQCQRLIDAKIDGLAPTVCRSRSFLFVSLTAEMRILKEQLVVKRRQALEGERRPSSHGAQTGSNAGGATGGSATGAGAAGGASADGSSQQGGEHFNAYYRLSAAIASFANQGGQNKGTGSSGAGVTSLGTSAALKGACFAAQLATSTPLTDLTGSPQASTSAGAESSKGLRSEQSQGSIRLSAARNREEARKVMNTILRRTSYPHNNTSSLAPPGSEKPSPGHAGDRKNSQPPPVSSGNGSSNGEQQAVGDLESGRGGGGQPAGSQLIIDPAMLMAAFPTPRKSTGEGSGILKQLIQTIDRQNQKQQQQQIHQTTSVSPGKPTPVGGSQSQLCTSGTTASGNVTVGATTMIGSHSQVQMGGHEGHKHEQTSIGPREQSEQK